MKKKVIGLSTLLLVLLLGLFTTSYAYNYTVTNSDIDLIVEHYFNGDRTTAKNNLYWALGRIYNDLSLDTVVINVETYSSGQITIFGFDSSYVSSVTQLNNVNYMKVNFSSTTNVFRSVISMYNGQRSSSWTTYDSISLGSGSQLRTVYLMYSNDLANNSGPWQNVEILQFSPPNHFTFIQNLNLSYSGDIALVSSLNDYLGVVSLGKNLDRIQTDYQYYDRYAKQWKIYHSEDLNFSTITDEDFYYYIRYGFNHREQYFLPNTLVQVYFVPKDTEEEFTTYFQPYYIIDDNTKYNTGGGIDLDDTFDDNDYWNYYIGNINNLINKQENDKTTDDIINNDNENTDKIIDTLTDDSQVDSMLSELTSGDANDLANRFGYSAIENPFVATIRSVIENTADVLLGSGNVTLDISFYGHQITLESQDFILPSNPVVTLIHLICNGFFIWGLYKYGFKLYQYINTGRIKKVIDETDSDKYYFF